MDGRRNHDAGPNTYNRGARANERSQPLLVGLVLGIHGNASREENEDAQVLETSQSRSGVPHFFGYVQGLDAISQQWRHFSDSCQEQR